MKFLIDVPNELHARMEIIKATRSLRTEKRAFLKELYLEAIKRGINKMEKINLEEGLQDG